MKRKCKFGIVLLALCSVNAVSAASLSTRDVINLWPDGIGPGSENAPVSLTVTERSKVAYWPDRIITGITQPNLTAFVPDHPNGTSVIVAPGGAYSRIVLDKEAAEMARWLNPYGVTVFLMQYRLPGEGHVDGKSVPLQDAQRAVRLVRANAEGWGLNPNKIGVLGASAAGHMSAYLADKFDKLVYKPVDQKDSLSAKPNFLMLLYPVISMEDGVTHSETRENLLGKAISTELKQAYSADEQVTKDNPPTFITVAKDDPAVPYTNSLLYAKSLENAGVPVELHVFDEGGHGFGIRDARQLPVSNWPNLAVTWMKSLGFINE